MRLLIDGDGCPVIDETISIAKKYQLEVIIFCDTSHFIEREGAITKMTTKGSDAVDFMLVNQVEKGDIVITQDYGLAAMVLARGGFAMSQNGLVYQDDNMQSLLFSRYVAKEVRRQGGRTKGPKKRTRQQDEAFMMRLTKIIEEN